MTTTENTCLHDLKVIDEKISDEGSDSSDECLAQKIDQAVSGQTLQLANRVGRNKRMGLLPGRKFSVDGWIDVNENTIQELDESYDYEQLPKLLSDQRLRKNNRTMRPNRSMSTDGWQGLNTGDVRLVYSTV